MGNEGIVCLSVLSVWLEVHTCDTSQVTPYVDGAAEPVHSQMSVLAERGEHPKAGSTCPPLHSWQSAATHSMI